MWIVLFACAPRGSTVSPWEDPTIDTAVDYGDDTASDTAAPVAACASTRSPSRWGLDVARSAVVRIEADFDPGTVHAGSLRVYGRVSGYLPGVVDVADGVATFTPTVLPHPGERLTAVLTAEATCRSGAPAGPLLWTWNAAVDGGTGVLVDASPPALDRAYPPIDAFDLDGDGAFELGAGDDSEFYIVHSGPEYTDTEALVLDAGPLASEPADIDDDGDIDLLVAVSEGVWVLVNTGGVLAPGDFLVTQDAERITSVQAADMDADGDLDLVVSAINDSVIVVYANDGAGSFTERSQAWLWWQAQPQKFDVGDLDEDEDLDVFVPVSEGVGVVLLNEGRGHLIEAGHVLLAHETQASVINDLDGDGHADVAATSFGNGVDVFLGAGDGTLTPDTTLREPYARDLTACDLDHDGDLELVVTPYDGGVDVWFNDGDWSKVVFVADATDPSCVDLDGDGALDVVFARGSSVYGEGGIARNMP